MLKNVMKMSRGQIYKFNLGDPPPIIKDRAICQTNSDIYISFTSKNDVLIGYLGDVLQPCGTRPHLLRGDGRQIEYGIECKLC